MGKETDISWCDHTFNHVIGCEKVSEGCRNCYASVSTPVRVAGKIGLKLWGGESTGAVRRVASESMWKEPIKWNKQAEKEGKRKRVFCASLADVFERFDGDIVDSHGNKLYLNLREDEKDDWWHTENTGLGVDLDSVRARLFDVIGLTPWLDWLLLTKRPENVMDMAPTLWKQFGFPFNVWMGTTVENQDYAEQRIPHLLSIPAKVRFLSVEPMLGEVNVPHVIAADGDSASKGTMHWMGIDAGINWVICGGESGDKARPMHPDWVRHLRDQCVAAGVAFHFKQWGNWLPFTDKYPGVNKAMNGEGSPMFLESIRVDGKVYTDVMYDPGDNDIVYANVGKKVAGRQIDGRTWDEVPNWKGKK